MPTLAEIRQQYPQYQDMSDQQLADGLYSKFYSDMPREEFNAKIGLAPVEQPITAETAAPGSEEAAFLESANAQQPDLKMRGTILPIGVTQDGEATAALPEFIEGPRRTIMDLLEGKRSAQDISGKEIFELGALFAGTSAASRGAATSAATPKAATAGEQVAAAGARQGVDLPRAVTSDSGVVQQAGKVASNIPIGGQPLRDASQKAIGQLDEAARRVESGFGSGSARMAGAEAERGVTAFAGKEGVLAQRVSEKYNAVDSLVDDSVTRPLTETASTAQKIVARRSNARIGQQSEAVKRIEAAISDPAGLNYQGAKDLRSYIGELLDNPSLLPSDISGSELKQIYGALTKDLRAVVEEAGGERALKAFEHANRATEKTMAIRENLSRILKADSEEAIFSKIEAMAGSNSRADIKTLAQVRAAVGKDGWDEIASAFIHKMGRDPEGNLTPDRLVSAWGKLSPQAKRVLFNTTGKKELASALDDIVKVSSRFKSLNQFANPSGTGQTVIGASIGTGLIVEPVTAVTSVLGARLMSSVLSRPATAKAFSGWAKAYELMVRKPTRETARIFKERSQVLAGAISTELGIPQSAARLAQEFQGAVPVKADGKDE